MGNIKLSLTMIVLGMALAAMVMLCYILLSSGAIEQVDQLGGTVTLGRSLKVISTEPSSPAVLKVGEKFYVRFSYRLGPSDSAQIWVRPYTRGSKTAGYGAHGSARYRKKDREAGVVEGWFTFNKPTFVDEVCVYMQDCRTGERVYTVFYKVDARWVGPDVSEEKQAYRKIQSCRGSCSVRTQTGQISIDVNNPDGEAGWKDEYIVELKPVDDTRKLFGVDGYRPHKVAGLSMEKPDSINTLPKFRHDMQRYFTLKFGDSENNQTLGVIDFQKPDRMYFPFDLYLDRDRNGKLAEDFVEDQKYITQIRALYRDGTTENYVLNVYSYSTENEPIGLAYQSLAGRYGILEADKKRIQVLVIDNSGNGVFNDSDDLILFDWDLDGKIDGSHQTGDHRPLFSLLELPGGSYQVVEFDAMGRRLVLRRQTKQ